MTRRKAKPKPNWILVWCGVLTTGLLIVLALFIFVPRQNVETQIVIEEKETLKEKVGGAFIDLAKDELEKELDERREERKND